MLMLAMAAMAVSAIPVLAEILRAVPADRVGAATGGAVGFSFLGVVAGGWALAFTASAAFAALVGAALWLFGRICMARWLVDR